MTKPNIATRMARLLRGSRARLRARLAAFVAATAIVALAAVIAPLLQRLPHANLSLLFTTGVLLVAVNWGLWPSIYASILSFLIFNFFFTAPYLTLGVSEEGDIATLAFFLIVASVTGKLAARLRDALANREAAVQRTTSLQSLTRRVAGAASTREVLQSLVERLAETLGVAVSAHLGERAASGSMTVTSPDAASELPPERVPQGCGVEVVDGWLVLPLTTVRGRVGHVALYSLTLGVDERSHADALIEQAAVAVERTLLVRDLADARLVSERERLRSALLSSVSHDLRTPLASIIGATSTLLAYGNAIGSGDQGMLLQSVQDEAERLDRHIQNLLDMTRLEQGKLNIQCDWEDLCDLVSAAAKRLRLAKRGIKLTNRVSRDAQFVLVHGELMEQVFVNLFDNVLCHAPGARRITVDAVRDGDRVSLGISDDGPGIPAADRERVFDPFYRIQERDRKHGSGLGLSICRGIVHAHGGNISAHPADGGGACIRIYMAQPQSATGTARQ